MFEINGNVNTAVDFNEITLDNSGFEGSYTRFVQFYL